MTNTSELYSQQIIENIIKSYLERGEVPTLQQIEDDFNSIAAQQDLSSSNFTIDEWAVSRQEISSANKYNGMNQEIEQDINILYKSLFLNSEKATQLFSRWQTKATALETRLKALETRINRLLNLPSTGYSSSVGDRFTDLKLVDLDESSGIGFNLQQNTAILSKDDPTSVTRIFLNNLRTDQLNFQVLTRESIVGNSDTDGTEPRFAFRDQNQFWKTILSTGESVSPMITELILRVDNPITVSKIEIYLHSSQLNSTTTVTPLVSTDGINYSRVAAINTALEGLDKLTFQFPDTEFTYLKFIFQKNHWDYQSENKYIWEFGAREIALYQEAFEVSEDLSAGVLISKPLSVVKQDQSLVLFNKVSLETCEAVTDETRIDYYISVAQEVSDEPSWLSISGFSTDLDNRLWHPISPTNRESYLHPTVLDFASLSTVENTNIGISYDKTGGAFISPANVFSLLETSSGTVIFSSQTSTDQRYIFSKPNQKSLSLQIDLDAEVDLDSLILWRNVGQKGINPSDTSKLVRGIQAGWEYQEPYYSTQILIQGFEGFLINVGNSPIQIDGVNYTGLIDSEILSPGTHSIRVHKDNWLSVDSSLTNLEELKAVDALYPYNHKLLIEGYLYNSSWPTVEEQIYQGVDRFAGYIATKVSIFDLINNVPSADYSKYSLDTDISETTSTGESYIFVLNTDSSKSDLVNEVFVLTFNLTNQLYSYVALKAEFRTTNSQLTPALDEYRIQLGL